MTFYEKQTVLSALCEYRRMKDREAARHEKRGEIGKALEARKESSMAAGLASAWAAILSEPCGTCRI